MLNQRRPWIPVTTPTVFAARFPAADPARYALQCKRLRVFEFAFHRQRVAASVSAGRRRFALHDGSMCTPARGRADVLDVTDNEGIKLATRSPTHWPLHRWRCETRIQYTRSRLH